MTFAKLAHGIPLHEASAFFLKMKTAAPDETGALEGQFAAPVEEVLAAMSEHVQSELRTQYAYLVYANSLRDLSHFAIAEHLEEHAGHEVEHAEFLLRRMSVLGGAVEVPDIPAPPPSSDPVAIIKTLIQFEQEGIAHWQQLRKLVGEDNPTRFKIEEYLATEQEHLDELWQLLPHTETAAAAGTPPAAVDPQASPQEAEPAIVGGSAAAAGDPALVQQKTAVSLEWVGRHSARGAAQRMGARGSLVGIGADAAADLGKSVDKRVKSLGHGDRLDMKKRFAKTFKDAVDTAKTASARVERFHPGTLHYHGAAMKLALASMSPTIFVPEETKEASAKTSEGLPDAAQGKLQPVAPPPALSGAAAGQHAKIASRFKRALAEMPAASAPAPGGPEAAELEQYLADEGAAMQQQSAAEDGYYRQRFTDAMARLQAAEQAQQAAEAQVQQLQEQVSMGMTQNQEALQQAQMIQQQSMQQANAANAAAAAAMQQSLAASNELLQQQQLATNMRDAMQGLKSQLMGIVNTQLPPSTTMEAGVSAQADQAQADQAAQEQALMGGQDPGGNQAGTPAAAGDAGTPPGAATPGKDGPGASPTASDPSSSPTAEKKTQSSESAPGADKSDEPAKEASDRFVGALIGAGLGAGITGIESKMSNQPLRDKVKKLEATEASGNGGFGTALNLAQSKMRLAMGELMEKHPGKASLVGAGLGAMAGANAAPHVSDLTTALRG